MEFAEHLNYIAVATEGVEDDADAAGGVGHYEEADKTLSRR